MLVGDGPLRGELEERARALGLQSGPEGALRWAGLREDVADCLSAMDLYLMTSQFEGLPLALLEAMALELPVVATPVGGIPEVIEQGVSGELVAPDDAAGLVAACSRLLGEAAARESYGRAGRQRVLRDFSMQRMSADLQAVYREVARDELHR
jgi:glycosyltransferase involved in cell wall biosynthesis